jgi:sn-glycerol 3-phosphate transport system permease protein
MARVLESTARVGLAVTTPRRRRDWGAFTAHAILIGSVAVLAFPLYYAIVISTQSVGQATSLPPRLLPSTAMFHNYAEAWNRAHMERLLLNSAVMALAIAFGKIAISMLSAFAIVYFDFRGKLLVFWMIFVTLMLPIPVRIVSTYEVMTQLGWVNTYWGLTVPLMASATGTFLWSILLPLSKANIAALFVILFVYGWNEYLWPLMITTTPEMRTAVVGVESLVPRGGSQLAEWNIIMAAAIMILLPPVAVIIVMQRWFVKGLIETEK